MSQDGGNISKLPDVGTTIFTVMSRRAAEQGAVNVGQGFPDYPIDPNLANCVADAVAAGFNQYAPMEGSIALRAAIVAKIAAAGGRTVDPENELTVSCGGTESIFSAIQAVIDQHKESDDPEGWQASAQASYPNADREQRPSGFFRARAV